MRAGRGVGNFAGEAPQVPRALFRIIPNIDSGWGRAKLLIAMRPVATQKIKSGPRHSDGECGGDEKLPLTERLASRGFRFTSQREQVYHVLLGERDHPTAETVFIRAKSRMPDI